MNHDPSNAHLSAEQLQALLEGELPENGRSRAEEHLMDCARCSAELDGWRLLFDDLGALPAHRPHEGFAARVMASVDVPEPRSIAARLKERLEVGVLAGIDEHVPADTLQDFLDGDLAARRGARIEAHLAACSDCTDEADSWLDVMHRLSTLERFAPSAGFGDRVMAAVDVRVTVSLAARIRSRIAAFGGGAAPEHIPPGILQDFVDGLLPARAIARVRTHVGSCTHCAGEVDAWRHVVARLDTLDRLAPSDGFAERVMHGFALAPSRAVAALSIRSRVLAVARRLVPQTREAWAALSGAAVTPVVVVGLVAYAVFSHPTLTLGSLASFAWWQISDLLTGAGSGLTVTLVQMSEMFGIGSLIQTLAAAPLLVASGVVVYSLGSALALRVLYKNLFANRPRPGRYAHVSTAS